jgi:membrane protein
MLGLSRSFRQRFPRVKFDRGRAAGHPGDIPGAGWKDILWRVYHEQSNDNIDMIAAGVAYYWLLALFPALAAAVSLYGLVADPAGIEQQVAQMAGVLPPDALDILKKQAQTLASAPGQGLSLGLAASLVLALWSASRGVASLITALNIAYEEEERRGYVRLVALAMALTLGAIVFLFVTLGMVVAVPAVLAALGPLGGLETVISLVRWPILAVAVMAALAVLFRYAPCRRRPKWRWVSWGAAMATVLWLLASAGFSFYVTNFGSYNQTYGSVGAVVILLLWLDITAYVVLLGAELNAGVERQTARDTTDGKAKPLGQRQAYVADTVGRRRA